MNILQTCGSHSWGGLEMEALKISHQLQDLGHRVTLLCPHNAILHRKSTEAGIPTLTVSDLKPHSLGGFLRLLAHLKSTRYEVIHSHLSSDLAQLVPAINISNWSGKLFLSKHLASNVHKRDPLHRFLYQRVDRILAISNYVRQNVIATCPVPPQKVHRLANGINTDHFSAAAFNRREQRIRFGIPEQACCIGLVGRITPKKGHREFLEAAAFIARRMKRQLVFWIVGNASHGEREYEREIRRRCGQDLTLSQVVRFQGHCDDVRPVLAALDILVLPSHGESFGNILLEAMATERPVVATDSGGVPDIITHRENGLLVAPQDPVSLSLAITKLLREPYLAASLAREGRRTVQQYFQSERFIERLLIHYHATAPAGNISGEPLLNGVH